MLSFEDCVGLCELTEQEIRAIAEHEHVPEIVAAEFGHHLLRQVGGARRIKRIILDDFAAAKARGDWARAQLWRATLRRFVHAHPGGPRVGALWPVPAAAHGPARASSPEGTRAAAPPDSAGPPPAARRSGSRQGPEPALEVRAASQTPHPGRSVGDG